MIELTLLGLHAVRDADGRELSSLLAQPKRFALLAYLAVGGGDGYHRRDTLTALFWPELDQFAARRALRNTLYHLREALGDEVIVSRGDDAVRIDSARLRSDVARLTEAVRQERYAEAVDCYRGELLAGMHFADAGESFESWLSAERSRIVELVLRACRALTDHAEAAGDFGAAALWAQRGCGLAPDDEGQLRRCLALMASAGDTGGALRIFETYSARLATEFAASPAAETTALVGRIRSGDAARPTAALVETSPKSVEAPAPQGGNTEIPAVAPAASRRRWLSRTARPLIVVVAAVAVLLLARSALAGHTSSPPALRRVLVLPFDNRTGDIQLQPLGRMTQDWLAQGLLRANLVEVVDPRAVFVQEQNERGTGADPVALAHRTGAGLVVSGTYYRSGDSLLVQATVMDLPSQRIVRVVGPIVSTVNAPVAALDELRSRVMSALASVVDARATQGLAGDELPPFDAYRDYVNGWDAFWHGDGPGSRQLFLSAARLDSAFIPAFLAAATAGANFNDCPLVDSLARVLEGRRVALSRTEQLSLQVADAHCRGRSEETLRLTLERADLDPNNASQQMTAAAAALWANRPRRALEALRRVQPDVDLAWNTDTTHFAYWGSVAEALHMLGRHEEESAAALRLSPGAPLGKVWLRASALAALARPTAALTLLDSALSLPAEPASDVGLAPQTDGRPQFTMTPGWVANWVSRELAVHGDTVASRQAAMRAVAWYRSRGPEERATFEERLVAAWSLEMAGNYIEADRIARELLRQDSTNVDVRGELAGLAVERGDRATADSLDQWLAALPAPRVTWAVSIYRARIAALEGRREDALARVREAIEGGLWPHWLHQEPALNSLRDMAEFTRLTNPRD